MVARAFIPIVRVIRCNNHPRILSLYRFIPILHTESEYRSHNDTRNDEKYCYTDRHRISPSFSFHPYFTSFDVRVFSYLK